MFNNTNKHPSYDRQCFLKGLDELKPSKQSTQLYWTTPSNFNELKPSSQSTQLYWSAPSNSFDVRDYVNPLTCALHGGVQGYTMNYSDEMMGALGGAYGMGKSLASGGHASEGFKDYYENVRDQARLHLDLCNEKYPWITGLSEITGAVISPAKFAGMGKMGVPALGAFAGYGAGEGDTRSQLTSVGLGISGAYAGSKSGPLFTQSMQAQTKPAAQYVGKTLQPYLDKDYSRRMNKRVMQTLHNPYTQSFIETGADYMFNRIIRNMWGDDKKKLNTY